MVAKNTAIHPLLKRRGILADYDKKAEASIGAWIILLILVALLCLLFYFFIFKPVFMNSDNPINQSMNYSQASPYYTIYHSNNETIIYPNFSMTPGEVGTDNLTDICLNYYSKLLVAVPDDTVSAVYKEYNITSHKLHEYEIDHFIPIALGGDNNLSNLWPEPKLYPGYQEKDFVQLYLRNQVCSGNLSLEEARADITNDWFSLFIKIHPASSD